MVANEHDAIPVFPSLLLEIVWKVRLGSSLKLGEIMRIQDILIPLILLMGHFLVMMGGVYLTNRIERQVIADEGPVRLTAVWPPLHAHPSPLPTT